MLSDDITEANYKSDRVYYLSESYIDDLLTMPFDTDNIKPNMDSTDEYIKRIGNLLGTDF